MSKSTKSRKTGEQLRREAIAATDHNLAQIEAKERGAKPKRETPTPAGRFSVPNPRKGGKTTMVSVPPKDSPEQETPAPPAAPAAPTAPTKPKGGKVTKPSKPAKAAKAPKQPKPAKAAAGGEKRMSALDAAAAVLATAKEPMGCQLLIAEMAKRGLWKSPGGATPDATLNAAIHREIKTLGRDARFSKAGRGLFTKGG